MAPPAIPALRIGPLEPADPAKVGGHRLVGRLRTGTMGTVYAVLAPGGARRTLELAHLGWAPSAQDPPTPETGAHLLTARNGGTHGGRPWAALDHVPGTDLATWVSTRGPLPEGALLCLAAAIADALAGVHAAGTVHGDVEPGTVVLAPDGPWLRDFGIARRIDDSAPAPVAGAPGWLAPERYAGAPPEPASDVFAWACVMTLAASGEPPFGNGGDLADSEERARLNRVELSAAPPGLRPLLRRALSADPGERPTARAAAEACLRVLARLPGGSGAEHGEDPRPADPDRVLRNGGGEGERGSRGGAEEPGGDQRPPHRGTDGGSGSGLRPRTAETSSEEPGPELGGPDGNGGVPSPEEEENLPWLKVKRPFSDPCGQGSEESPNTPGGERSRKKRFGGAFGGLLQARTSQRPHEGPEPLGPGAGGAGRRVEGAADPGSEGSEPAGGPHRPTSPLRHHLDRVWPDTTAADDDPAWEHDPPLRSVPASRAPGDPVRAGRTAALVAGLLALIAVVAGGGALLLDTLGPEQPEHRHPHAVGDELLVRARDTVLTADTFELTILTHGGNGTGPHQSARTRGPTLYDRVRYQNGPEEALRWNSTVGDGGPISDRMWWEGRLLDAGDTSSDGDPASWAESAEPDRTDAHTREAIAAPLRSAIDDGRIIGYRRADYVPAETAEDAYPHLAEGRPTGERDAVWIEGEFPASDNPAADPAVFTLVSTEEGVPLEFSWEEETHFHMRPTSTRLSPEDLGTGDGEYPRWWYTEYTFISFGAEVDLQVPEPGEVREGELSGGG
ncbi:protein kinase domain-containing protein [Nocardiopsis xinjiangensis]|uniref:protein kinase domain-containing protein n=1 Tax=Nocardiopsis xinjiangensis TaxID=124285 RepID=UPI000346DC3A|nr:protein kinase [Nocardiopsis xinjiangensis]